MRFIATLSNPFSHCSKTVYLSIRTRTDNLGAKLLSVRDDAPELPEEIVREFKGVVQFIGAIMPFLAQKH